MTLGKTGFRSNIEVSPGRIDWMAHALCPRRALQPGVNLRINARRRQAAGRKAESQVKSGKRNRLNSGAFRLSISAFRFFALFLDNGLQSFAERRKLQLH